MGSRVVLQEMAASNRASDILPTIYRQERWSDITDGQGEFEI